MSEGQYLFSDTDWSLIERGLKKKIVDEVDNIEGNRLLNSSVDDLCEYIEQKFWFEVPTIHEDDAVADRREAKVDISGNRSYYVRDRSRPAYVTGTAVEITVPFSGDAGLFQMQPTTITSIPPEAEIRDGSLIVRVVGVNLDAAKVRIEIDRTLDKIQRYLTYLRSDIDSFNKQIRPLADNHIKWRRQKLLNDQNLVASLGFPLKQRDDPLKTFTAPEVRRRILPTMPKAGTAPYRPEPMLSMGDYEHILSVMTNMAFVMERSPSAFAAMDEEGLRWHFLVQLNGQYEGQATGETFNYGGKTDILIRVQDRNIFVAECKYWRGPQNLIETIDQLLGYASWRDTKVAIVIFNRNRNFSKVLETIPGAMTAHPNFKRDKGRPSETSFRYVFAHRDDPNREMILTVLAFDLPKPNQG